MMSLVRMPVKEGNPSISIEDGLWVKVQGQKPKA